MRLRGVVTYEKIDGQDYVILEVNEPAQPAENPDAAQNPPWQLPGF